MDPHSDTAEVDEESAAVGEPSANNVITSLLKAAKILSFCVPELESDLSCPQTWSYHKPPEEASVLRGQQKGLGSGADFNGWGQGPTVKCPFQLFRASWEGYVYSYKARDLADNTCNHNKNSEYDIIMINSPQYDFYHDIMCLYVSANLFYNWCFLLPTLTWLIVIIAIQTQPANQLQGCQVSLKVWSEITVEGTFRALVIKMEPFEAKFKVILN